jgi:Methylase involved in ubiquinone/menaquinone biosynthesis
MNVDYFARLWKEMKHGERSYKKGDKTAWDRRVDEFNHDGPDERIDNITRLLLEKQMLNSNSTVLDIGCGPGKFVAEFAQTAKSVTGVDISSKMLQSAAENSAAKGVGNTDFMEMDWHQADLESLQWRKKFSLVTAIMSPALDSKEGLDKILEASSECGLLCHFVQRYDSIGDEIKRNILRQRTVDEFGNVGLYCSFNILWGYNMYPEVTYFETARERIRNLEEATQHYISRLEIKEDLTPAQKAEVLEFLKSKAENGLIKEKTAAKIACIYWRSK